MTDASTAHVGNRFDLSLTDIGPLFRALRVSWNAMSPLAVTLDAHTSLDAHLQTAYGVDRPANVAPHCDPRIATILARPDVRVRHAVADASGEWSVFVACWRRADPNTFVVLLPRSPDDYAVLTFDSAAAYLAWWVSELSSGATRTIANCMPPLVPLPALVYALHAVDAHRRAALRQASEYGGGAPLWIAAAEFAATMRIAITSRDTRWLLPAFLSLTPGVIPLLREPSDEQLAWLSDAAFLHPSRNQRTGEEGFSFGEAAVTFGEELNGGLRTALGVAVDVWTDHGAMSLEQVFLAPTVSANHCVRLEPGDDGVVANHQALTLVDLYDKLYMLLRSALDPEAPRHARVRAERFARPTLSPKDATGVVGSLPAGQRESRTCATCGKANAPNQKFCGECGATLERTTRHANDVA